MRKQKVFIPIACCLSSNLEETCFIFNDYNEIPNHNQFINFKAVIDSKKGDMSTNQLQMIGTMLRLQ